MIRSIRAIIMNVIMLIAITTGLVLTMTLQTNAATTNFASVTNPIDVAVDSTTGDVYVLSITDFTYGTTGEIIKKYVENKEDLL